MASDHQHLDDLEETGAEGPSEEMDWETVPAIEHFGLDVSRLPADMS